MRSTELEGGYEPISTRHSCPSRDLKASGNWQDTIEKQTTNQFGMQKQLQVREHILCWPNGHKPQKTNSQITLHPYKSLSRINIFLIARIHLAMCLLCVSRFSGCWLWHWCDSLNKPFNLDLVLYFPFHTIGWDCFVQNKISYLLEHFHTVNMG